MWCGLLSLVQLWFAVVGNGLLSSGIDGCGVLSFGAAPLIQRPQLWPALIYRGLVSLGVVYCGLPSSAANGW